MAKSRCFAVEFGLVMLFLVGNLVLCILQPASPHQNDASKKSVIKHSIPAPRNSLLEEWKSKQLSVRSEGNVRMEYVKGVMKDDELPQALLYRNVTKKDLSRDYIPLRFPILHEVTENQKDGRYPVRVVRDTYDKIPDDEFMKGFPCSFPHGLKTAEILCVSSPISITCASYCAYGHTFDEGIVRRHSCVIKENTWSEPFEECRPFVECKPKLKAPGNLKCVGNQVTESTKCEIQCHEYEDFEPVKKQTFECQLDGTWKPPLPFCVELNEERELAGRPQVVKHTNVTYPKMRNN